MRTVSDDVAVRLYRLGDDGGAVTLLYGTLAEARQAAQAEPEASWPDLYLQTADDVIGWLDLEDG